MSVRTKHLGGVALLALLVAVSYSSPAHAYGPEGLFGGRPQPDSSVSLNTNIDPEDRPERAQSVLQHPRPDYDPVPVPFASFDIYPSVEFGAAYDSNIFATKTNQHDDSIYDVRPIISAASNWNRHALQMTTFGDLNYYRENSDSDFSNMVTDVQGRYDIMNQSYISSHAGYQHLALPASSPNNSTGSTSQTFDVYQGGLSFYRGLGVVHAQAAYDFKRMSYNNAATPVGSAADQTLFDRNEHTMSAKVSYDITENLKPYIKGSYNMRGYDQNDPRESDGFDTVVGATADFGGITSLDAYIGWLSQDYSKFASSNVNNGVKFGGNFQWNVTGMTTIALEVNRTIEETSVAAFDSYKATGGSATVTHELLRNVLLEGDMSFTRDDFQGVGTRQDDLLTAGAGTRWLINRNLYTDLSYSWDRRLSSATGADYLKHVVSLRIGVQM